MRSKFRAKRTITLAVLSCILLYLWASKSASTKPAERIPPVLPSDESLQYGQLTLEPVNPGFIDDVQALWGHWSQVFHDDRPGEEHVHLIRDAHGISTPHGDNSPRQPPTSNILKPDAVIGSLRSPHAALLKTLNSEDVVGDVFSGTGVVTVGGGEYFGPAIVGLLKLRATGSTLPVEIFVANAREYEPAICDDYLPKYGARCHILADFLYGGESQKFAVTHYQLKALAILFSSFAEVLYLDSDSIPLVDPTGFFTAEPYKTSGLVIWPDFWISTESPLFYTIAGLPEFPSNLPKSSSEAGQLLINKKTHLKSLLLAVYYNIYGPDYYYPLLSQGVLGQGDKETFMAAAVVSNQSYYRVKTSVDSVGRYNGQKHMGSGMIQHNPVDDLQYTGTDDAGDSAKAYNTVKPAFLHANTPKMNAGHLVDEGDLFTANGRKRLRLWGSSEDQVKQFGYDLEKEVWGFLVKSGCELAEVVEEWKGRKQMCARLEAHWNAIF